MDKLHHKISEFVDISKGMATHNLTVYANIAAAIISDAEAI